MLEPEVLEELEKTLEEVKELSKEGTLIIVEGKKDERALRKLGINGEIFRIPHNGKTILNSLEDLPKEEEFLILTDFDRTGEELAKYCRKHLEKLGANVLIDLRRKLRNFIRKAVKDIEGLGKFLQSERVSNVNYNPKFENINKSLE